MDITSERFIKLFLVCLSWQWDPISVNTTYSTVDKVMRILEGLDLITPKDREQIPKNKALRHMFSRKCYFINRELSGPGEYRPGEDVTLYRDRILGYDRWFVVPMAIGKEINKGRLLKDMRIHLTYRGFDAAQRVAKEYEEIITKAMYRAEVERQKMELNKEPKAIGPIMKNYRRKIASLFGDD